MNVKRFISDKAQLTTQEIISRINSGKANAA